MCQDNTNNNQTLAEIKNDLIRIKYNEIILQTPNWIRSL